MSALWWFYNLTAGGVGTVNTTVPLSVSLPVSDKPRATSVVVS